MWSAQARGKPDSFGQLSAEITWRSFVQHRAITVSSDVTVLSRTRYARRAIATNGNNRKVGKARGVVDVVPRPSHVWEAPCIANASKSGIVRKPDLREIWVILALAVTQRTVVCNAVKAQLTEFPKFREEMAFCRVQVNFA